MKRAILIIAILFFALPAFADDDTCVVTTNWPPTYDASSWLVLLSCTADSADASLSYTMSAAEMVPMNGFYLYSVAVYPGSTAPTDNSDLAGIGSRGRTYLAATGNGANIVDATSFKWDYPEGPPADGTRDHYAVAFKNYPITWTITGNSVNSANVNIALTIVK